jgi:hypothetical protein
MKLDVKIIIILFLFLTSCKTTTPPLYQAQVDKISVSTSNSELNELLLQNKPKYEFSQLFREKNYNVRIYDLVVGTDVQFIPVCLPTTGCMQIMVDVPVNAEYAIIQELPKLSLFSWGKFEELSKSNDENVNLMMVEIKNKVTELSKEKK